MSTIDPAEVEKFAAMSAEWWDPEGAFKPLHGMNPCRLDYITRQIAAEFGCDLTAPRPLEGLRIVDIGCGGGLLCEPMTRLGAEVTGCDAEETSVGVARHHAVEQGLDIDYRATTAEALASEIEPVDVVLAQEVIEHVADPATFVRDCHALLKPGGILILSTLNRTPKSFALAIIGAEWVLRWLPRGTHDWSRFVTPDELAALCEQAGLDVLDRTGMVMAPLSRQWSLSPTDLSVNYMMLARSS
ncbi:bifunctional 2-polyprenyl-6-hydroxyphenol methylase/3-demethylubiquinol 3-O-methyltransferase UbiG [Palleronia caenipelagi]|uniref:Ubiquinone biosynthesis O-methyltransferase n=1 Tax=Palleronia caenipelagi TaxID=2489174 RepID=A0A547Q6H0_9RHOB|nr:bifunctional 2-polyprenyl-6-hydroxyphenol methylase/3-demethylubiquinol 3-O-methyltransferase UbiG [Palleronia caenipelagi]TRD21970.1 bifunctional 2-polyprenyl-6-hydroxyphenol methylase/3-demethylubiquinol 3-O-methyltransferase UbiG [Palleronia caenipelagi]